MRNRQRELGQILRYLVTGVATSLLDLSLYSLLSVVLQMHAVAANLCSTAVTVIISYFINRAFVFRAGPPSWKGFISFAGLTLFTGMVLQSGVIWVIITLNTHFIDLPDPLILPGAKMVAMAIGASCNYLGYRFIFKRSSDKQTL